MSDGDNFDIQPPQPDKRLRSLTEKGLESFKSVCKTHKEKLLRATTRIEEISTKINEPVDNLVALQDFERQLQDAFENFRVLAADFRDFLIRTNTSDSKEELVHHDHSEGMVNQMFSDTLSKLLANRESMTESPKSVKSSVSRASSKSSGSKASSKLSAVVAIKRAKAEAARVKLEFAEQEASLKKQQAQLLEQENLSKANVVRKKAELEADLHLLAQKSEAAAAEAEAQALESIEDDELHSESSLFETAEIAASLRPIDTFERTCQYVRQQNDYAVLHPSVTNHIQVPDPHPNLTCDSKTFETHQVKDEQLTIANELTKFLVKKDLLLSRLTVFTDRPETYNVWKSSFKSIMADLSCTPTEELDLLVKWLGPESKKYAISIRSSNASQPARGLKRLWERLDERYGSAEMLEAALKTKLASFPKLTPRDNQKLYDLADILSEIESIKEDKVYAPLLSYYDTSSGVKPVVQKLTPQLQEKWTTRAANYKRDHGVPFPPFSVFASFIREMSRIKNDPSFNYDTQFETSSSRIIKNEPIRSSPAVNTRKTEVDNSLNPEKVCPLHKTKHTLNECRVFRGKHIQDRMKFLKENRICFRCCDSDQHVKRACTEPIRCEDCGSNSHATALHFTSDNTHSSTELHGGEADTSAPASVSANCLQICGGKFSGKSCAKNVLVRVYPENHPENAKAMYAIVDDQSNKSLAKSEFFALFNIKGEEVQYRMSSCSGDMFASGRTANGFVVESLDGSSAFQLPALIECDQIPCSKDEIPTPEVAGHYSHLQNIQDQIPPLDNDSEILILIGRDLPEVHHVLDQRIGHRSMPYAQQLHLGWVIIGETCLGKVHKPNSVTTLKTHTLSENRGSIFTPCLNRISVKEYKASQSDIGNNVFQTSKNDEKLGLSVEDREFISLMNSNMDRSSEGNWVFPLPFRRNRPRLPDNRSQALRRAKLLERSLIKNTSKRDHFVKFMKEMLEKKHAEVAPPLKKDEECWYLPIFGVYHPKKPDQIRVVFDSSAKYDDVSLNDILMSGPDMINSLLGILLRFRKEHVAVTADIEKMFYGFLVKEEHRNFLRFLWFRDNDPDKELVEYRMRVHVFGNSPSPAIAMYGLCQIANGSEDQFGSDVRMFVEKDFYVDDGLISLPSVEQAVDLMQRTQRAMKLNGNLRLHKISSNEEDVVKAFDCEDLAKDLKDLDFDRDDLPMQRSLGLYWNLDSDTYTFRVSTDRVEYTRRGMLSLVNSIFDPLGFAAPVTLHGKLFLRKFLPGTVDWDEPLPENFRTEWEIWKDSLSELENLYVPRPYSTTSYSGALKKQVFVFCDASEKAIAAVAYLVTTSADTTRKVGFILGKVKVAPSHGHTIPRLELCAAVLAVEIAEVVSDQLSFPITDIQFFTDSKVVLGYISNRTRRFYVYVSNRVERIQRTTNPTQWSYIVTDQNPADSGTRGLQAAELQESYWLQGSHVLGLSEKVNQDSNFLLVNPDEDKEVRPVNVMKSDVSTVVHLGSHRFERFSSWKRLVESVAFLQHMVSSRHKGNGPISHRRKTVEAFQRAESFIIREAQRQWFSKELLGLKESKHLPKNSTLTKLNPFIDDEGLLRVGGRLDRAPIPSSERNPIILHRKDHIAILLVRHHHEAVKHQGRHFTEGAVRAAGLWIIGGKRLVSSIIHKCVICRKLRGRQMLQQMADLPADRLQPGPPFTSVGVDTFGPWSVIARRTRGGLANSKRWAVLFTCLTTRAIHIEVIEELSSSAFINALRRFVALRGKVKVFRSDRGSNFIGATDGLKVETIHVEAGPVSNFLYKSGSVWLFNPPHASHMGGVWERMIGVSRRILDSLLLDSGSSLTHDMLVTLMAEVCAIVNSRPLVPVSTDPDSPQILSPNTLLTQKFESSEEFFKDTDSKDMYKAQWKKVQSLADRFWVRWKQEYLQTLQKRVKWTEVQPGLKPGDVVLLKDTDVCRNSWPVGVIVNAIESIDGHVRKAEVRVIKENKAVTYTRPVTQLVILLTCD